MLTINKTTPGPAVPEATRFAIVKKDKWTWDRLSVQSTEIIICTGSTDTETPILIPRVSSMLPARPLFVTGLMTAASAGVLIAERLCVPVSGMYSVNTGFLVMRCTKSYKINPAIIYIIGFIKANMKNSKKAPPDFFILTVTVTVL